VSTDPHPRLLPDRANLRHLKAQAKDLLETGEASSLADAQFQIARLYGFASWPKLRLHLESLEEAGQLKLAIDSNDIDRVKSMMTRNPALHRAPLGYGKDGPLTWVAECRIPCAPPSSTRLAIAEWMIENGSDVHQGGDAPLMRAALQGRRIPMMELLVAHGANVNAEWHGEYPIIYAPCEAVDPAALRWLLDRGANPNCRGLKRTYRQTALDYLIAAYGRSPRRLSDCIDILLAAGGTTRYDAAGVLEVLGQQRDRLATQLNTDPQLVHRRFPELDCGSTGARRLLLTGATLLHVAAEYGNPDAAALLLARGADVNARALVDEAGVGGQTAIFHAVTQFDDAGLPMARMLVEQGADLGVRVKLPGHYEQPDEVVECTPLGYALRFQSESQPKGETVAFLREQGAID
jgi:ankyrin repeat protein